MLSQLDLKNSPPLELLPSTRKVLESKNFQLESTAGKIREKLLDGISLDDLFNAEHGGAAASKIRGAIYKIVQGWNALPELKSDPISKLLPVYLEKIKSIDPAPFRLANERVVSLQRKIPVNLYDGDWDGVRGQQINRLMKLQERFPGWLSVKGGPPSESRVY